jgi:hypothetical protein
MISDGTVGAYYVVSRNRAVVKMDSKDATDLIERMRIAERALHNLILQNMKAIGMDSDEIRTEIYAQIKSALFSAEKELRREGEIR